jgi:hypothetical protein
VDVIVMMLSKLAGALADAKHRSATMGFLEIGKSHEAGRFWRSHIMVASEREPGEAPEPQGEAR